MVSQLWIIRKPLETSGNRPRRIPAGFQIFLLIKKKNYTNKKFENLAETSAAGFRRFPEVSGQSIIDGPHGIYIFSNFQWNSCVRHSWGHLSWLDSLDWSNDHNFNGIDCYISLLLLLAYWPISSPFWRIRRFQVKNFLNLLFCLYLKAPN